VVQVRPIDERFWIAAGRISSCGARAAGIFPLRFGGQAIGLTFLAAKPLAKIDGVLPRDIDHWMAIELLESGVAPGILGLAPFEVVDLWVVPPAASAVAFAFDLEVGICNELLELANRHFVRTHIER